MFTNLDNGGASFKTKLEQFGKQMYGKTFDNFQHSKERVTAIDLDKDKYMSNVAELLNAS